MTGKSDSDGVLMTKILSKEATWNLRGAGCVFDSTVGFGNSVEKASVLLSGLSSVARTWSSEELFFRIVSELFEIEIS